MTSRAQVRRTCVNILFIFNRQPYDGTDVTWNGLRLAGKPADGGNEVRLSPMSHSVISL